MVWNEDIALAPVNAPLLLKASDGVKVHVGVGIIREDTDERGYCQVQFSYATGKYRGWPAGVVGLGSRTSRDIVAWAPYPTLESVAPEPVTKEPFDVEAVRAALESFRDRAQIAALYADIDTMSALLTDLAEEAHDALQTFKEN